MARVIGAPIAIITIHLRGWRLFETPAVVVYQALITWLHQNVAMIEIDFDFTDGSTTNNFVGRLNKLMKEFATGGRLERSVNYSRINALSLIINMKI